MSAQDDAYHELYTYAMTRGRERFLVQHVADAQTAQTATAQTKPIGLVFALLGLYLHVELGASGLEVQRVHIKLAKHKREWPTLPLPTERGPLTPIDVLATPAGEPRDAAIDAWCAAVWRAYASAREAIAALVE